MHDDPLFFICDNHHNLLRFIVVNIFQKYHRATKIVFLLNTDELFLYVLIL